MCVCVCACVRVCVHACMCVCMHVVCKEYSIMLISYMLFLRFYAHIFIDLVKCSVLTFLGESSYGAIEITIIIISVFVL